MYKNEILLKTANCKLQIANCKLQTANCEHIISSNSREKMVRVYHVIKIPSADAGIETSMGTVTWYSFLCRRDTYLFLSHAIVWKNFIDMHTRMNIGKLQL